MPETSASHLPYPSMDDAPNVPADLQALVQQADPRLVLRAKDASDRNTRYPHPEPGMLVAGENKVVWLADSGGNWHTVHEPPGAWVDMALQTGVQKAGMMQPQARQQGGQVWLRGAIERADGKPLEMGDVMWLPAGMEPEYTMFLPVSVSIQGGRTYGTTRLGLRKNGSVYLSWDQDPGGRPIWATIDCINFWTF